MATTSEQDNIPDDKAAEADPRKKSPFYESIADPGPNPLQGRTVTWDGEDGQQRTGTFLFNTRDTEADGRQYAYVRYSEDVTGTIREMPIAVDRLRVVDDAAAPSAAPTGKVTPEPTGPGNRETLISGERGPEVGEEERQRRAALLAAHLREIDEEDARRAEEERRKKAEDAPQGPQRETSRLGSIFMRGFLQIKADENFFTVSGGTLRPGSPIPQMTNSQLKAFILTAALEKNWHTIYLYKDRSTIDPMLTSRAQQMIAELQRPGQPLEGYQMRVSPVRMRDVEPWNEGRPLYSMFRTAANYKQDTVEGIKNGISSRWNSAVAGMLFTEKPATAAPVAAAAAATTAGATIRAGEAVEDTATEAPVTTTRRANPGVGSGLAG